MASFKYKVAERVTRKEAAEQLVDIAYALAAGGPLELRIAGERVSVPVADEVLFERESQSNGRRVALELQLTWSSVCDPDAAA